MPNITSHSTSSSHLTAQADHATSSRRSAVASSTATAAETAADEVRRMERHNYIPPTLTLGSRTVRVGAMLRAIPREDRLHFSQVMHNVVRVVSEPSPTTPENELPAHEGQPGMDADGNITRTNQRIQSYVGRYLTPDGHIADALVTVHTDAKDNLLGIATSDVATQQEMKLARFKPPVALGQAGLAAKYGARFYKAVASPSQHQMLIKGFTWGKDKGAPNFYLLKEHELAILHELLFKPTQPLLHYERTFLNKVREKLEQISPALQARLESEGNTALQDLVISPSFEASEKDKLFLQHLMLKYSPPPDINNLSEDHMNRLYDMLIGERIPLTEEEERFANKIEDKLKSGQEFDQVFSDPADLKFAVKLLSKYQSVPSMRTVSEENLKLLRSRLMEEQPLQNHEKVFLDRMQTTPFFITHATPSDAKNPIDQADGRVSLFSRQKLLEKEIGFNEANTEHHDISQMGSDDNIFFALECGDKPQKSLSRFGDRLMRFPVSHPAVKATGTLSLVNPLSKGVASQNMFRKVLNDIQHNHDTNAIIDQLERRQDIFAGESVFHGDHMLTGLGLSVIKVCRQHLPTDIAKQVLENGDLNGIINGLFRPEVMVPRSFSAVPHDEARIIFSPYSSYN